MHTNVGTYWLGDIETALQPHPTLIMGAGPLPTLAHAPSSCSQPSTGPNSNS